MNIKETPIEKKEEENIVKTQDITGSLLSENLENSNIPKNIITNVEFSQQIKERKDIVNIYKNICEKVPNNINIENALEQNLIKFEEIEKFYNSIIELIKKDEKSKRLLLYFPFELLPNEKQEKITFFKDFYKSNWEELLNEINLREDFNEGDILDKELRNSPLAKVSKAAHLIPSLVEKEILSIDEVLYILENEKNEIITESILDTLRILADKNYLKKEHINKLKNSKDINTRNVINLIQYDQKNEKLEKKEITENTKNDFEEIFNLMNLELNSIEDNIFNKEKLTHERMEWLKTTEKERIINRYSEIIYNNINNKEQIENILKNKNLNEINIIAIIKALERAIISSNGKEDYLNLLNNFKSNENVNIKNQFFNTLNKLVSINIKNDSLNELEIKKRENKIEEQNEITIKNILLEMKSNPLLSKSIYSVAMLYGSQMKGYGKENSDLDIGVFIKEDVDFNNRSEIEKTLKDTLNKLNIKGSVMEFWLKKEKDSLWIQDFQSPDNNLGDSIITSPLTSSWFGDKKTIKYLQEKLISEYIFSKNKKIFNIDARELWLKDMEHSLIQYRLMHKGYKERNINQGGIDSIYKDEIDGDSVFYDSGFRKLATKIYLEKVFLPQLEK